MQDKFLLTVGQASTIPKAQIMKEKMDKIAFIKMKNFCSSKDVKKKKMKGQAKDWETISFNSYI